MHDAVPPAAQVDAPSTVRPDRRRARLRAEVWIVLGLSVGQAAVYALVRLLDRLTRDVPIGQQVTTLNPSQNERAWLDLVYQLLDVVFTLVPVALALYLLSAPGRTALRRIGLKLMTTVAVLSGAISTVCRSMRTQSRGKP